MSDETKIEEETTEDVEAHADRVASRVVSQVRDADGEDTGDVEAHAGRVASQVRSANDEGDDDVQAHIRVS
jgi:hypothetical protein